MVLPFYRATVIPVHTDGIMTKLSGVDDVGAKTPRHIGVVALTGFRARAQVFLVAVSAALKVSSHS